MRHKRQGNTKSKGEISCSRTERIFNPHMEYIMMSLMLKCVQKTSLIAMLGWYVILQTPLKRKCLVMVTT